MVLKILLLNPPTEGTSNVVRDLIYGCWCSGKRIAGASFPPLSLLSLYTLLKKDCLPVLVDFQIIDWDHEKLIKFSQNFDAVLISSSNQSIDQDRQLLSAIKSGNPRIISMIFGSYSTFYPDLALSHPEIDIIALGEPEPAIPFLIDYLNGRNNCDKIPPGVGFKESGKKIIKNPDFNGNLDDFPIPDRTPIRNSFFFNPLVLTSDWTTSLTSRGCPGSCNYCTSPYFFGKKYRFNSVNWMKEEVLHLKALNYREIFYRDETFSANRVRLSEFCKWLINDKQDMKWIANVRVGTVNLNDLALMKRAGCHTLKIGVESGSPQILKNIKKGITIEATEKLFENCHKVGIKTHAHMMIGAPGESFNTLEQTYKFLKKIKPYTATFNLFTPLPGTPIYQEIINTFKIQDLTGLHSLENIHIKPIHSKHYTNLSDHVLSSLVRRSYAKYYLNFNYIIRLLTTIRDRSDVIRVMKSGVNVLEFIIGKN